MVPDWVNLRANDPAKIGGQANVVSTIKKSMIVLRASEYNKYVCGPQMSQPACEWPTKVGSQANVVSAKK